MLIAFNKPFGVISRFTPDGSPNHTLAEFGFPEDVYAIGRLDADSEGLLLLSDEAGLNERLLHPRHEHLTAGAGDLEADLAERTEVARHSGADERGLQA